MQGITLVTPLVRKLGPKANPAYLSQLPLAAAGMWAFYAGTWVVVPRWAVLCLHGPEAAHAHTHTSLSLPLAMLH